jgi:hypothetical protein
MSANVIWRVVRIVAIIGLVGVALRFTWYFARLPESNCSTYAVLEVRSTDQRYVATLLEKNCNAGETFFYSLKLGGPGWVIPDLPLESDMMHPPRPTLQWADPHTLGVTVRTNTLSGAVTEHWVDGLTLVRTFAPGASEQ